MTVVFVARSANLSKWAGDVGLGKHLFKIGVAADKADAKARIEAGWAGETDWRAVAQIEVAGAPVDEDAVQAAVARREKPVDPNYYPRLKGTEGVFRVDLAHVHNAMLMAQAMASADAPLSAPKPKPKDVAEHLLKLARTAWSDGANQGNSDDA